MLKKKSAEKEKMELLNLYDDIIDEPFCYEEIAKCSKYFTDEAETLDLMLIVTIDNDTSVANVVSGSAMDIIEKDVMEARGKYGLIIFCSKEREAKAISLCRKLKSVDRNIKITVNETEL